MYRSLLDSRTWSTAVTEVKAFLIAVRCLTPALLVVCAHRMRGRC